MKILYVQHGPGLGGAKISLYHMLKNAHEDQESFVILALPPDPIYENMIKDYTAGVYYLEIPTWHRYKRNKFNEKLREPFGNFIRLLHLIRVSKKIKEIIEKEQIDLVHTNTSITAVGALASWLAKKPHVWHIRESFGCHREYRPILGDKISYWIINKLSELIICNSSYAGELLRKQKIHHVVINNGLNLDRFTGNSGHSNDLRQKLGVNESQTIVAMVGNLSTQMKNHSMFLELAGELLKDELKTRFIIFGNSSNLEQTSYTMELAEQAIKLEIFDQIIWADFVSESSVLMKSIDILVHPALTEGSGRVVMEAMAAGKPVVAMNSGGVKELIHDGETGFFIQPGDLGEMVNKVRLLAENENLRRKIGQNARNYAEKYFSAQRTMDEITKVYKGIVN